MKNNIFITTYQIPFSFLAQMESFSSLSSAESRVPKGKLTVKPGDHKPFYMSMQGIEPSLCWWETKALTTEPTEQLHKPISSCHALEKYLGSTALEKHLGGLSEHSLVLYVKT